MLALPLSMRDEIRGHLMICAPTTVPPELLDSLLALATQISLAVEGASLAEDLHRRQSEARFRSLVAHSSDLITVLDESGLVTYQSPSIERVLGYTVNDIEGTRFDELLLEADRPRLAQVVTGIGQGGIEGHAIDCSLKHRDGTWIQFEMQHTDLLADEHVRGIVLNSRDVSERKAFEDQLAHQAFHDPVTNLANRPLFSDRVQHALTRAERSGAVVAVLFIDLDEFKTVNDSLGHAAGDLVLREVARRLTDTVRPTDTVARFGGDEFAVLLEGVVDSPDAADAAARLLRALEAQFEIEGKQVFPRASIGICLAEPGAAATDAEELLRNADVAMYMAKRDCKGSYRVFEPTMHERVLERLELRSDLQKAIEDDSSQCTTSRSSGSSSARSTASRRCCAGSIRPAARIQPDQFIPLAEETGLIIPIGRWVLQMACRDGAVMHERFPRAEPLTISVNLSVRQLQSETIVADVQEALDLSGLPPSSLVLEITESVMLADTELAVRRLQDLKSLGVRLAMDDFGTGYSSLSYLGSSPSRSSRWTVRSSPPATTTLWRRRSSRSARTSRSRSSPKASSTPTRQRGSRIRAASSGRASTSLGRWPTSRSTSTSSSATASDRRSWSSLNPMQHSYEALDRPGGLSRAHLLSPLRHRDFRVLWTGMAVSLLGDGIFLVAVAWQAYLLWNAPAALALVGIGMTVPTVAFLLPGGVVSDRLDRRLVMLSADAVRALAVGILAVLALTSSLRFWELVALVGLYGAGSAFFIPAFDAIVPDLLPPDDLAAANSLDQFVRPIALRLAGPAIGGWLVGMGTGVAFAVNAASFGASAIAVLLMRPPARPWRETPEPALRAVKQGLRFVRRRVWLWGTLLSAALAYLVFLGLPRCCSRSSSRTTSTLRRACSALSSRRAASGPSAPRS